MTIIYVNQIVLHSQTPALVSFCGFVLRLPLSDVAVNPQMEKVPLPVSIPLPGSTPGHSSVCLQFFFFGLGVVLLRGFLT